MTGQLQQATALLEHTEADLLPVKSTKRRLQQAGSFDEQSRTPLHT